MNKSAYLTTGLAIKTLAALSRVEVTLHGADQLPDEPTIFVINHFTRLETLLLPYHIYTQTSKPVWSLAHSSLFQGGLGNFFQMVGVISTADPRRDELIVRSLLTGEANWIIFPEGTMMKTKQIVQRGQFMVSTPEGPRKPHTGAASLALRSELFRRYLLHTGRQGGQRADGMLDFLELDGIEPVQGRSTCIVPVNVTYYPIRARENVLSVLATKMVKGLSERMVEEIMTEGTMLLSGADIDIRFGAAIHVAPYLRSGEVERQLALQEATGFLMSPTLKAALKEQAETIMQRYMTDIYAMTTVNHEHLFAFLLRLYPWRRIEDIELKRRVFLAACRIGACDAADLFLHRSLAENQVHLLTDDRCHAFADFVQLALEKKVLFRDGSGMRLDRARLFAPLVFHRGRIDNPIEIMANEVMPLKTVKRKLTGVALQPRSLLRFNVARYLAKRGREDYHRDCQRYGHGEGVRKRAYGEPFLLPALRRSTGVVLIHSYLAVPEEVRSLGRYLRRRGMWVYAPRLPGHGTSAVDLATRRYAEWLEAVENGWALLATICRRVVLCGVSVGAALAFEVAGRIPRTAGVVAINPALRLHDFSTNFMPAIDVWNRLTKKIRGTDHEPFCQFTSENPHINYRRNPYVAIQEVGRLLEKVERQLPELAVPTLVIQADRDPIVSAKSGRKVFDLLGARRRELVVLGLDRHVIVNGPGADQVHRLVGDFIFRLPSGNR
ncbi:MAG: alpha/beta fold hydrolase [Desulfopila sp.]